jgi:hypothetical protein
MEEVDINNCQWMLQDFLYLRIKTNLPDLLKLPLPYDKQETVLNTSTETTPTLDT